MSLNSRFDGAKTCPTGWPGHLRDHRDEGNGPSSSNAGVKLHSTMQPQEGIGPCDTQNILSMPTAGDAVATRRLPGRIGADPPYCCLVVFFLQVTCHKQQ